VHRFEAGVGRQVARHAGERPPQVLRPTDEGDAAVVRDVQPLVRIGGPRIGPVQPGDEPGPGRVGERPQPECAVDVQPAGPLRQPIGDLVEGVERTGVHLAGLRTHQDGPVEIGQQVGPHPALVVGGHDRDALPSEPHEPERLRHRRMPTLTDHHIERRRTEHAPSLRIPAEAGEERVPAGCEARGVRHRRTGDERNGRLRREPQEVDQPALRHLVELGRHRRHHGKRGVLVPRTREP
jgi:hypothetical protein